LKFKEKSVFQPTYSSSYLLEKLEPEKLPIWYIAFFLPTLTSFHGQILTMKTKEGLWASALGVW
jgi:hypothetical protein